MKVPDIRNFAAVVLNVLLLAVLLAASLMLARRFHSRMLGWLARALCFLAVLIVLVGFGQLVSSFLASRIDRVEVLAGSMFLVCVLGFLFIHRQRSVIKAANTLGLIFSPFVVITLAQAVWNYLPPGRPINSDQRFFLAEKARNQGSSPRILWLVFDELDFRAAFVDRPDTVQLSEFDRFRQQAFHATNAQPPGRRTLVSMPSLISGIPVADARPAGPDDLLLTLAGSDTPVRWADQRNIFAEAAALGSRSGIVGWYLPYCRILGRSLDVCTWHDLTSWDQPTYGVAQYMSAQIGIVINMFPLIGDDPAARERNKVIATYLEMKREAMSLISDPDIDLVLVHWPVPHLPGVYNRLTDDFDYTGESTYMDNLVLADRTLGELRRHMEDAGTWDETFILVTSDHWWRVNALQWPAVSQGREPAPNRNEDPRVPFTLKLSRQQKPVDYDKHFSTLLAHDLLLGILREELTSAEDVVHWIDNRSVGGNLSVKDSP